MNANEMVMMMTTTTMKKPSAPLDVPVLPTADDYRKGMDKMRAKINCPVLSKEEQVLADELLEFDAKAQSKFDVNAARLYMESEEHRFNDCMDLLDHPRPSYDFSRTAKNSDDVVDARPCIAEYLKEQYQANMLARYPDFEAATESDLAMLKLKMDQMFVFNTVISMMLGLLLVLGFWLIVLMA